MVSARGYGGSTGSPSETALVADGRLAYGWLRNKGIEANRIVVFGESLGTGIAVQLAASLPVAAIILDSPYSALVDVAAERLPFLPVRLLMWDQFNSMAHIAKVSVPLLMVHCDGDVVVPYALGQRLYAAVTAPKRLLTVPGDCHVPPLREVSWTTVEPFLASLNAP